MANQQKSKLLPFAIIGAVSVAIFVVIFGLTSGWFDANSSGGITNANRAGANASRTPSIPANAPPGAVPPNGTGAPTASVTVEEFADFQCPTCASTHPVVNEIKSMYGSRIRFIFRDFPLQIPAHDKSYEAAIAAEAAGMQGKFWDMQNMLFTNQQAWTANPGYKQIWMDYAQKIGLNVAKFQEDLVGLPAKQRVDEDMKRGRGLGVNSTPTIYVNGISVPASEFRVEGLKQIIDGELAKAAAAKPAANTPPQTAANSANANK